MIAFFTQQLQQRDIQLDRQLENQRVSFERQFIAQRESFERQIQHEREARDRDIQREREARDRDIQLVREEHARDIEKMKATQRELSYKLENVTSRRAGQDSLTVVSPPRNKSTASTSASNQVKTVRSTRPEVASRRWWLSWYEYSEDVRPMDDKDPHILGWWLTGYGDDEDGEYETIVAWLEAPSLAAAWDVVDILWPCQNDSARKIRFENEVEPSYVPSDRFPICQTSKQ